MIDYYKYIHSPEWFKRTEVVRLRLNGKCECCLMRSGSCVHHRTYLHLGCELDAELLHVCRWCHKLIHRTIPERKVFIWPSRLEFLRLLQKEVDEMGLNYEEPSL